MQDRKNFDTNEFEGRVKITGFPSKESLIEKIDSYVNKYKSEENENIYEIEKETSTSILLNFHKNTELANLIIRKLKLLQLGNKNYEKLKCHLTINVISPKPKEKKVTKETEDTKEANDIKETKDTKAVKDTKDSKNKKDSKNTKDKKDIKDTKEKSRNSPKENKIKKKEYNLDIYSVDAKNNPRMNKLIGHSSNFMRRNINKYLSPDNNKMKIYESIFLGGPYVDKSNFLYEDQRKNKAQWINQKGFIPYISKQTILKNAHMIDNILYKEPALKNPSYNFRQVEKTKWVGKTGFYA